MKLNIKIQEPPVNEEDWTWETGLFPLIIVLNLNPKCDFIEEEFSVSINENLITSQVKRTKDKFTIILNELQNKQAYEALKNLEISDKISLSKFVISVKAQC